MNLRVHFADKRLGIKRFAGQTVKKGDIIVRQVGMTKRAGKGTCLSRNFSIHAAKDDAVCFEKKRYRIFSGRTVPRVTVQVK